MLNGPVFRPVISVVRPAPDGRSIEVTLDLDGWIADAVAEVDDDDGLLVAACRATCVAVAQFLPGSVHVEIAFVQHLQEQGDGPEVVLVGVELIDAGPDGPEELLGVCRVRHDLQVAAVRATLDALGRRLSPYVPD
ncbi:hypothetical protein [Euzebya rosea]|uniref:hypothetical protein n=1 Tax=Euzebya rosea TaxID=2052804 RepID=UPI000D3EA8C4|nr:hypothetical protein [Euzebya rosea]